MLTYICLQYRVATELPYRHKNVYGAEKKGNSFAISPSLRLSTPVFLLRFAVQIFMLQRLSALNFRRRTCKKQYSQYS